MKIEMQLSPEVWALLNDIRNAGGRPVVVGGSVRDTIFGTPSKDVDIEVFKLRPGILVQVLRDSSRSVELVGKSFGVFKVKVSDSETVDVSVPRREQKVGAGHKAFEVVADPHMSFAEASLRRDLTINALGWDPFTGDVLDEHEGLLDIVEGVLRHTSPAFAEDPLRVLRVMRFAARFDMRVDSGTVKLCAGLLKEFDSLPRERVWGELEGMLLKAVKPSRALQFLADCGWIKKFPELDALQGVKQDPKHHPEGDAFVHTANVLDAMAVKCRQDGIGGEERLIRMSAALLHDVGKAVTTEIGKDGRWHAIGHEDAGVPLAEAFMERLGVPKALIAPVLELVREHMVPHSWKEKPRKASVMKLSAKANLRRVADLHAADCAGRFFDVEVVEMPKRMAEALKIAEAEQVMDTPPAKWVTGKLLIAAGMKPGKTMGELIEQAFAKQLDGDFADETEARQWAVSEVARGV